MAGNPVVPFQDIKKGQRYLISLYDDTNHQTIHTERGVPIQDLAGIVVLKIAGSVNDPNAAQDNHVQFAIDSLKGSQYISAAKYLVFKSLDPAPLAGPPPSGGPGTGGPGAGPGAEPGAELYKLNYGSGRKSRKRKSKKRARKTRRRY
ncbi:MAG: hypothetical protein EB127_10090 [Alphaproteobacteria bacterium]|nr:hypothetical protein [Alphaproteobacteria bacterium]